MEIPFDFAMQMMLRQSQMVGTYDASLSHFLSLSLFPAIYLDDQTLLKLSPFIRGDSEGLNGPVQPSVTAEACPERGYEQGGRR